MTITTTVKYIVQAIPRIVGQIRVFIFQARDKGKRSTMLYRVAQKS